MPKDEIMSFGDALFHLKQYDRLLSKEILEVHLEFIKAITKVEKLAIDKYEEACNVDIDNYEEEAKPLFDQWQHLMNIYRVLLCGV